MKKNLKNERIGSEKYNKQGCLMKVVEYINKNNIVVEFQDEYKCKIKSSWGCFISGKIKNPYFHSVYNIGVVGNKYPITKNGKRTKEYATWYSILTRCFDDVYKAKYQTYVDVICCKEWLFYENFYEWLHSQENFEKWLNTNRSCIDKDILVKGNKIYSPETCCLVPCSVNMLFVKANSIRGKYPIGVSFNKLKGKYNANYHIGNKKYNLGYYNTPQEAFNAYKTHKEGLVKLIAEQEFENGNIIEKCYDAMISYKVEITD